MVSEPRKPDPYRAAQLRAEARRMRYIAAALEFDLWLEMNREADGLEQRAAILEMPQQR